MSFWDRITGRVVEAAGLGQKKRAAATGILAFDAPLSDLRLEIAIKSHPWLQNTATTTLLLSVWAAQALQDMAAVLESTAQRRLGETGKLPEATFTTADGLYDASLNWIDLAQTALATIEAQTDFVLQLRLPAPAPRFEWMADAPPAHFVAAIQAVVQLGTAVEDALNNMQNDRSRLPRKYDGAFESIAGTIRFARAKLDQVEAAESDRQAVRLTQGIWAMLQEVVRLYFLAGQQIAMPGLIDPRYDADAQGTVRARRLPPPPSGQAGPVRTVAQPGPTWTAPQPGRPGTPWSQPSGSARSPVHVGQGHAPRTMGQPARPDPPPRPAPPTLGERLGLRFDAWSLTDPGAKSTYQNDPTRIAELEACWRSDTNPDETYRLFGLVMDAVKADQVSVRPGEFSKACPWISTFVARADVTIGTEQFVTGQLFTIKVGVEGDYFGRGFERLGFMPGAQRPKPKPRPQIQPESRAGAAAGPPRIDTQHRGARKPSASGDSGAHPTAGIPGRPSDADMWRLTAAFQRPQRRANPADVEKLRQLWCADPDPASTIAVHEELLAAVRAGTVRQQGDEGLRDCPWSQVYVAVNRVTIGGVQLKRNEKFALEVGLTGGTFKRRIGRLGSIAPGALSGG